MLTISTRRSRSPAEDRCIGTSLCVCLNSHRPSRTQQRMTSALRAPSVGKLACVISEFPKAERGASIGEHAGVFLHAAIYSQQRSGLNGAAVDECLVLRTRTEACTACPTERQLNRRCSVQEVAERWIASSSAYPVQRAGRSRHSETRLVLTGSSRTLLSSCCRWDGGSAAFAAAAGPSSSSAWRP